MNEQPLPPIIKPLRRWFRRREADPAAAVRPDEPIAPLPRRGKRWWIVRGLALALFLFVLLVAFLAITAPLSKSLEPIAPPQITLISSDGVPIAQSGAVVDEPVEVDALPAHVVDAFLSIEDRRFYDHWGVDPRGLARAAVSNATGSGGIQGGSTITQQLAKLTFLTPERSLIRKLREMTIAFWLEAWLTKDEILGRYLSNVYFGDNVYGLRAASLHYFFRQPEKLKPEQAILLAGLVQAPSRLAPTRHPERARERAAIVRAAMVAAGKLTPEQADALPDAALDVRARQTVPTGTYFADWAMPRARELTKTSYEKIALPTTLNARLQGLAEAAVRRAPLGSAQVAMVVMRPDGEVVAMVGGKDYAASTFNRATQARRQPGSTFKTFVWLAALRNGMTPDTLIDDGPITQGGYLPKNAGEQYEGEITLARAFTKSSNVAAVRVFREIGGEAIVKEARKLGIRSPLPADDPSMALGTSTMTLLELTTAYAAIAQNSWPVAPRAFVADEKGWLDWLSDWPGSYGSNTIDGIRAMLRSVVDSGTGRAARLSVPAFGKTGTTQDNRDALFVGFAGEGDEQLVVGVWVGNDDNSPLGRVNGGGLPARIWADFMARARAGANRYAAPARRAPVVVAEEPAEDALGDEDGLSVTIDGTDITIDGDGNGASVTAPVGDRGIELRTDGDGISVRTRERPPAEPAPTP